MTGRVPLPGFPAWTGAHAILGTPTSHPDTNTLHVVVSVRITRRARWWARWRYLTGREVFTDGTPE
ncbi:hypothetical protein [Streptomyces sp. NBC_01217]|uniref:hypothetical protein n=1 Tax=Streptomyces sp. NBC_01217 TaxID=2903779 RepID=UPI002E0D7C41|nr:hypothetical protein OG507_21000 [Streptomyces sp. NBC_01217]